MIIIMMKSVLLLIGIQILLMTGARTVSRLLTVGVVIAPAPVVGPAVMVTIVHAVVEDGVNHTVRGYLRNIQIIVSTVNGTLLQKIMTDLEHCACMLEE